MRDALRAELLKLRKRPSTWVLVVLSIYFVVFTYFIVDFIIFYLAREGAILLTEPLRLQLARVLPHELIENVMEATSYYVNLLALILGALTSGSEYGWGTLKTILKQRSSRSAIYVGQAIALALVIALMVICVFALSAATSWIIAIAEIAPTDWPPLVDIAESIGAAWLILTMYATLGQMLGTLFRSAAPAIGFGIFWIMVVEQTFIDLFSLSIDQLAAIQEWLPAANATTLAGSWGLPGVGDQVPVLLPVSGNQYAWMTAAYLIGSVVAGVLLSRYRDVR
jgi:ABC-type transport system involved in multi-copper enzyme maturation permease subunit